MSYIFDRRMEKKCFAQKTFFNINFRWNDEYAFGRNFNDSIVFVYHRIFLKLYGSEFDY